MLHWTEGSAESKVNHLWDRVLFCDESSFRSSISVQTLGSALNISLSSIFYIQLGGGIIHYIEEHFNVIAFWEHKRVLCKSKVLPVHSLKAQLNMEVSSHPDHYPHERTTVPIEQEGGWTPGPIWMFWRREKSLAPTRIPTPDHPVHILVTIPNTLLRLLVFSVQHLHPDSVIQFQKDYAFIENFNVVQEWLLLQTNFWLTDRPLQVPALNQLRMCGVRWKEPCRKPGLSFLQKIMMLSLPFHDMVGMRLLYLSIISDPPLNPCRD